MLTHFRRDILRQPAELATTLTALSGGTALSAAASLLRNARSVFLTGIGASWNACIGVASLFHRQGYQVVALEAAELLHFAAISPDSIVIAISRTGRSIEIVQLIEKVRRAGASVVAVTNCADSPLAKEADAALVIPITLDHAISVNTHSTLALAAAALASSLPEDFNARAAGFLQALKQVEALLEPWSNAIAHSSWLAEGATYYFLARGPSLASCFQSRLLWEEGTKSPATAMSTSGFRHGPQEIVAPNMRFCIWMDPEAMRSQDLSVAFDLRKLGAQVALIGHDLPADAADLVFQMPATPAGWQFVLDVIPMQLAADAFARLRGVDCDSFRVCSYIVEDEHGILGKTEVGKV